MNKLMMAMLASVLVFGAVGAVELCDGDFELGPGGGCWRETTTTRCEWILDPQDLWGVAAHSGQYAWWGAGYCGGDINNNSVQQVVTVPQTSGIDMYGVLFRFDADDADVDVLRIQLGFKLIAEYALSEANNSYPSWVHFSFPVPPAAVGQTATLKIKGRSLGARTGNVLIDDVSWLPY